ncbi:MAG: type II toxin-antitoxin system RelE/ParE family toxin [candidate division Zixibacteria bacterium]|nr:type II toxin-antitoxin system RelE/ParE family toxin [candidate division Zixibacteria bacterium]
MKIDWTEPAIQDLESIRAYISKDAEYYAIRFVEKIIEAIDGLENFPLMGRPVPEAEEENIRELLFQNYRIIYRVEAERILILTIMHGSRDLSQKKPKPWSIF